MLNIMWLISTSWAANEPHSRGLTAQLGPDPNDSNLTPTNTKQVLFCVKLPDALNSVCKVGLKINDQTVARKYISLAGHCSFYLSLCLFASQGGGGAREHHKKERMEVGGAFPLGRVIFFLISAPSGVTYLQSSHS